MRTRHALLPSADPVVRVTLKVNTGEHPQLSVQPIRHRSFWRRLWVALRYLTRGTTVLSSEDVRQLTSLVALHNLIVRLQDVKRNHGRHPAG